MGLKEDIADAIQAHGAWKAKFRDYLSGKTAIDLATVGQTHCCKLGQWLEHEGLRLLPQKDHDEVCKLHAEFHRVAAEVTGKIKQKDFNGARKDLAPDGVFNQASHNLMACLLKATQHVSSRAAPLEPVAVESKPAEIPPSGTATDTSQAG